MKHFKKIKRTQVAEMRPVEQIDIDVENNQIQYGLKASDPFQDSQLISENLY